MGTVRLAPLISSALYLAAVIWEMKGLARIMLMAILPVLSMIGTPAVILNLIVENAI